MARVKKTSAEINAAEYERVFHKPKTLDILDTTRINIKCKNENQKLLLNSIKNNDITICTGPPGSGKTFMSCYQSILELKSESPINKIVIVKSVTTLKSEELGFLKGPQPLYEMVLTPNGWVKMGDLKVGDYVINELGEKTSVIEVLDQDNDLESDIYRLTLRDGRYVDACINHGWNVRTKDLDFFTVKTDFLLKHYKKVDFFLPEIKPVNFSNEIELEVNPYLLGVLLGDGCLTGTHVRFCSIDDEIVEKVQNIVSKDEYTMVKNNITYNIRPTNNETIKNAREIVVKNVLTDEETIGYSKKISKLFNVIETTLIGRCVNNSIIDGYQYGYTGVKSSGNNPIKNNLIELGVFGKKSYEKFIPEHFKFAKINDRVELLRGLLDTDGTIKPNGEITFITTSERLADDIMFLVRSLGGQSTKYKREKKETNQILRGHKIYQRRDCFTVGIKFTSNDINPFYLKRKADRFKSLHPLNLKIKNIEKIGKSKIRCIKIDSPSQLYITRDFIVTHNSLEEKMEPFIYSFIKNFEKVIGPSLTDKLQNENFIETLPIAYMRGINIDNAIIIIDEVQNITIENVRTILTRLGENSKMILLGDINQIDIKNKKDSSLSFLVNKFKNIGKIGIIEFNSDDIIRHPIIIKIEEIFNKELNKPIEHPIKEKVKQIKEEKPKKENWFRKLLSK
jgi:phosphate starvation-inducible protein PhoH